MLICDYELGIKGNKRSSIYPCRSRKVDVSILCSCIFIREVLLYSKINYSIISTFSTSTLVDINKLI